MELLAFFCYVRNPVSVPRIFCKEKAPDPGAGLVLFPQEKCLRRLLLFFCWKRLIWKYLLEAWFFSRLPRPAKFCLYLSDFVKKENCGSWCRTCSFSPRKCLRRLLFLLFVLLDEIDLEASARIVVFFFPGLKVLRNPVSASCRVWYLT